MESATITKVTLRKEKLRSGKLSLYLDYYPPIWNPHIKKMSRREFLGLYLIGSPKDKFELDYNEEIMLKARGIRATRELAIINEEFGFLDRTKKQADFLEYFESKTKEKYQKWEIVYKHFKDFCNGRCLMKDVTIGLCNDFRTYILKIRVKQSGNIISRNSAAGYWSTFRALLKLAYKEGWLRENVNDYLDRIDWEEPKINYLEIEEVKRLAATPCKVDVLKRASLFACMTGLRISDILQLRWENIELSPDGGYCMRIRTQKTKTQATLPLSDEALSYCGVPSHGMVFKGLSRAHTREPFKKWLKDAGIKKKITFHGLRHTYATLLITNGTDIYTVSKMLTHKNVATTQIYAEVVNQKKRDAANSISLKWYGANLKAGLTQQQLAERIGTKKTYISRLENGKADVQLNTLFESSKVSAGVYLWQYCKESEILTACTTTEKIKSDRSIVSFGTQWQFYDISHSKEYEIETGIFNDKFNPTSPDGSLDTHIHRLHYA